MDDYVERMLSDFPVNFKETDVQIKAILNKVDKKKEKTAKIREVKKQKIQIKKNNGEFLPKKDYVEKVKNEKEEVERKKKLTKQILAAKKAQKKAEAEAKKQEVERRQKARAETEKTNKQNMHPSWLAKKKQRERELGIVN